ncbi:MAG: hypothetical protein Tp131SUR933471_45 [Prokaryotic dsDNA virus sp.]|nr:MAG: hypothetical protein Tp131SUR933471_45 [Prokaryotic dsDNA virus sp.]|tara:strand:- start:29524 stop:30225 length:702 start_codon:yes stop_codon:yes gene_type:complete
MKVNISLPATLKDIPLRDYQKFLKIADENKEAEDPEFLNMKMLEIFCGLSLKDLYKMKITDFSFAINHINELFKEKPPLTKRFSLSDVNGDIVEFGFIPKLEDMSVGEFVDLDNYINDSENMHKALAVLYRPIVFDKKGKYLIQDYDASEVYQESMKSVSSHIGIGALVFFYRLGNELSSYLMDYFLTQAEKGDKSLLRDLQKSGVGINQFMHLVKETSLNLRKLKDFPYTKP